MFLFEGILDVFLSQQHRKGDRVIKILQVTMKGCVSMFIKQGIPMHACSGKRSVFPMWESLEKLIWKTLKGGQSAKTYR